MNNSKNMLVLKDLPSNLIEEAYVVLNPSLKAKIQEMEKNKNSDIGDEQKKILSKNYILEEAKYVLLNYVSKFETKKESVNKLILEKKYRKLKRVTISTLVAFFIYVVLSIVL